MSIGTGVGGAGTQDVLYRRYYAEKIARAHPFSIPRTMNSAAASQVGMSYGLRGPGICVSTACASAGHSIGEAFEMIRAGRADVMLAGGADAPITAPVFKVWEAMRVLANPTDPATACRPFSRDRQGIVIGEGAAVLVLEEWDRARARGRAHSRRARRVRRDRRRGPHHAAGRRRAGAGDQARPSPKRACNLSRSTT